MRDITKDRNYTKEELKQIVKNLEEDYEGYLDALGEIKEEEKQVEEAVEMVSNIITAIDKTLFVEEEANNGR